MWGVCVVFHSDHCAHHRMLFSWFRPFFLVGGETLSSLCRGVPVHGGFLSLCPTSGVHLLAISASSHDADTSNMWRDLVSPEERVGFTEQNTPEQVIEKGFGECAVSFRHQDLRPAPRNGPLLWELGSVSAHFWGFLAGTSRRKLSPDMAPFSARRFILPLRVIEAHQIGNLHCKQTAPKRGGPTR